MTQIAVAVVFGILFIVGVFAKDYFDQKTSIKIPPRPMETEDFQPSRPTFGTPSKVYEDDIRRYYDGGS